MVVNILPVLPVLNTTDMYNLPLLSRILKTLRNLEVVIARNFNYSDKFSFRIIRIIISYYYKFPTLLTLKSHPSSINEC